MKTKITLPLTDYCEGELNITDISFRILDGVLQVKTTLKGYDEWENVPNIKSKDL